MSEILNLSALCRCCHTDGHFKTLNSTFINNERVENYAKMLQNTFNINLAVPSINASNMICDVCICSLRDAARFREQILACEDKFEEYVKNELSLLLPSNIKDEAFLYDVKLEDHDHLEKITIKIEPVDSPKSEVAQKSEGKAKSEDIPDDLHLDRNDYDDLANINIDEEIAPNSMSATRENKSNKDEIGKCLKPKIDVTTKSTEAIENTRKIRRLRTVNCEVCSTNMLWRDFPEHIKGHPKPFTCKYCKMEFNAYNYLKKHLKSHPHEKRFQCDTCNKSFKTKNQLIAHCNLHTREKVYQCDLCKKEFLYKHIIRRHLEVHKGDQRTDMRYQCPKCLKMFNNRSYLTAHIQTVHEKLKSFHCHLCPKSYAAKKTLKIHLRVHTGELPYTCDTCEKGFRCFSQLTTHQKRRHGKKLTKDGCIAQYECKQCNATFDHRGLYISHLKTHSPQGLICEQCGKGFYCLYTLKRHILIHSGYRPFACELCSRKYTTKFQLERHVKKYHEKIVQKFKCEVCGKDVENIQQHLRIHNDRRFACEYCDRTYSQLNTLNRHVRELHSETKLYRCDVCKKSFVKKRTLQGHKCEVPKKEKKGKGYSEKYS